MEKALRLKHHLRAEPAGDDLVFLLGERRRVALRGRAHRLVLPLLDGRRGADEIAAALAGEVSAPEVHHALLRLQREGYVETATADDEGFWQALDGAPREDGPRAPPPVAVRAVGGEDPRPVEGALAEAGVVTRAEAAFVVVVTGDYLDPALDAWNRRALDEGTTWALLKPGGVEPWIGPIFRPGAGPCWACLAHRLRHNRPVEVYLARRRGDGAPLLPPLLGVPASRTAALSLAAVLIGAWLRRESGGPLAQGRLVSLDLARAETRAHAVTSRPQCPACGDPTIARAQALAPVALEPCPKRYTDDGGHRAVAPEETFARLSHLVSPITGIVASLGPAEGRDHPLRPVQIAVQRSCPNGDAPSLDAFSRVTAGKGRTEAQARTGALCEAIERYSAAFAGDEPILHATLSELGGDAVPPPALLCISEAQHRARDAHNARVRDPRHLLPLPFDERLALGWLPAWSLTHARRRHVPAAYCLFNLPASPEERCCAFDPSGHAAGNTIEEAILQGFLERVERDAVSLWWYNRARRPAVDLRSFAEPYFEALERHYRAIGRRLWVLDLTTDLGVPTFAALARSDADGRYAIGFGCHLEARLGVQRALTELNQVFDPSGRSRPPWDGAAVGDAAYLRPDEATPARPADAYAALLRNDLRDDVIDCVQRAARLGLETLVVDQTRPDTGLRVVHVVVPGLRHMWPRFGPGRLYEAPVRLGWLDRPTPEADLNPTALYM